MTDKKRNRRMMIPGGLLPVCGGRICWMRKLSCRCWTGPQVDDIDDGFRPLQLT